MDLKKLKDFFLFRKPDEKDDASLEEVCIFPLPNVVLLPGAVCPLHIFEERYKMMTEELLSHNRFLAMSLAKPSPKGGDLIPNTICGAGNISLLEQYPDGRKDIFVEGRKRLRIKEFIKTTPCLKAICELLPDVPFESDLEEKRYHRELSLLVKRWIFLSPQLEDHLIHYVELFTRPHNLADFVGYYFLETLEEKQALLETLERQKRVEMIFSFLRRNVRVLEHQKSTTPVLDYPKAARVYH